MKTITLTILQIVGAVNALITLGVWLKPGMLAFRLGQLRAALSAPVAEVDKQFAALRDRFCLKDERGEFRSVDVAGSKEFVFRSDAEKAEFIQSQRDLETMSIEVLVPLLLTEDHILAIEDAMLPADPSAKPRPPVDFAALVPLMEQVEPVALVASDVKPNRRRGRSTGA